jgi:hypothetical protein
MRRRSWQRQVIDQTGVHRRPADGQGGRCGRDETLADQLKAPPVKAIRSAPP